MTPRSTNEEQADTRVDNEGPPGDRATSAAGGDRQGSGGRPDRPSGGVPAVDDAAKRVGDVEPNWSDKGECEGRQDRCSADGCPLFATLGRRARDGQRRVRGCDDPVARGKRNRRSGLAKQRAARKALGIAPQKFGDANEERWADAYFANEVKSGRQCGPLLNWWKRVEAQVLANEATVGDRRRPVRAVAMPEGWGDEGLVVVRLSTWRTQVGPALDEFYGSDT